ncbi:MAG: hypothetical protein H6Q36_711, partial [Chloroflexi bacterium]|nr:hypothetical protein [Chloroflexota bacterium]
MGVATGISHFFVGLKDAPQPRPFGYQPDPA